MFTRFIKEFETTTVTPANTGAEIIVSDNALLETTGGWKSPALIKPGMQIATLDGGFVTLRWISRAPQSLGDYFVPAGALNNCSGMTLPADTRIGLEAPIGYAAATSDYLSVPLSALDGFFGIRKATGETGQMYRIGLSDEEMIWTNTGALLHARGHQAPFFDTLSFADARSFLALMNAGHYCKENRESSEDNLVPYSDNSFADSELAVAD